MALDHLKFSPFSGVGVVNAFKRNAVSGAIDSAGYDFGESTAFKIKRAGAPVEMNTSRTTDRGVAYRMPGTSKVSAEIKFKTLPPFVESLMSRGTWTEQAAGNAVTGWTAPMVEVGQVIFLPSRNVNTVTVKDSGSKTLPVGQYSLDPVGGTIRVTDLTTGGPYTQPLKVDYTPGAVKVMSALAGSVADEYLLQFNGINAYDESRKAVSAWRCRFNFEGEQDFIMEQYGEYTLMADLLKDDTRQASAVGGQYYALYQA